jgi:hypothetical protein
MILTNFLGSTHELGNWGCCDHPVACWRQCLGEFKVSYCSI